MRLTARFLQEVEGEKQVYFTGSGAANYPIEGWAAYCASKAAVHQYAEVVAKEHPGVRIHAFRPGKVDTPMQAVIRESSSTAFADKAHFVEAFEQGNWSSLNSLRKSSWKYLSPKAKSPLFLALQTYNHESKIPNRNTEHRIDGGLYNGAHTNGGVRASRRIGRMDGQSSGLQWRNAESPQPKRADAIQWFRHTVVREGEPI